MKAKVKAVTISYRSISLEITLNFLTIKMEEHIEGISEQEKLLICKRAKTAYATPLRPLEH